MSCKYRINGVVVFHEQNDFDQLIKNIIKDDTAYRNLLVDQLKKSKFGNYCFLNFQPESENDENNVFIDFMNNVYDHSHVMWCEYYNERQDKSYSYEKDTQELDILSTQTEAEEVIYQQIWEYIGKAKMEYEVEGDVSLYGEVYYVQESNIEEIEIPVLGTFCSNGVFKNKYYFQASSLNILCIAENHYVFFTVVNNMEHTTAHEILISGEKMEISMYSFLNEHKNINTSESLFWRNIYQKHVKSTFYFSKENGIEKIHFDEESDTAHWMGFTPKFQPKKPLLNEKKEVKKVDHSENFSKSFHNKISSLEESAKLLRNQLKQTNYIIAVVLFILAVLFWEIDYWIIGYGSLVPRGLFLIFAILFLVLKNTKFILLSLVTLFIYMGLKVLTNYGLSTIQWIHITMAIAYSVSYLKLLKLKKQIYKLTQGDFL